MAKEAQERTNPLGWAAGAVMVLALVGALVVFLVTGGGEDSTATDAAGGPDPGHVHGLGVPGDDGALYVAAHNGLFRAERGQTGLRQVSAEPQDFMGFSVATPQRLVASGHPAAGQELPPLLGLIESLDGGRTWAPVSLTGEADFHALEADGERVYGFDGATGRFLASTDGGRTWTRREVPAVVFDLAIDPRDPDRVVAASERGLLLSTDAGRYWEPVSDVAGLVEWASDGSLWVVDGDGRVLSAPRPGGDLELRGTLESAPVAFGTAGGDLYVGLEDGRVMGSTDGGATWALRAQA